MEQIVRLVGCIGVDGARFIEEHIDPQFKALTHLYHHIEDRNAFPRLVVANALVSYQLSGRGEEWWWEFAHWFSRREVKDIYEAYSKFLPKSRTNRRLVHAKLKRLERAKGFLMEMDVDRYYKDMLSLRDALAGVLNTRKDAKTVVFAVKMFGYAMRIATGEFVPYPMEVPIPVDSRIERVTKRFGRVDPIHFWNTVAGRTGVPPLHIDSILWPVLGGNKEVKREIVRSFGRVGEELVALLSP